MFYYRDTRAGRHTLTASAPGTTNGTQVVTVTAGAAATVAVTPASGEVRARGLGRFTARATDVYGNAAVATISWTVTPAALGKIVPGDRGTATFTAGRLLRTGRVTARAGDDLRERERHRDPREAADRLDRSSTRRALPAHHRGGRRRGPQASVRHRGQAEGVKRNGSRLASARGVTGPAGKTRVGVPGGRGCFMVAVTRAVAQGFTWDGRTPRNRVCRR